MLGITLFIALLNIGLGFLLALHLGYGPPEWREACGDWTAARLPFLRAHGSADLVLSSPSGSLPEVPPSEMLPEAVAEEGDGGGALSPAEEPADAAAEPQDSGVPLIWDLNEKFVETSILRLNVAMLKSGQRCTKIDTLLRACQHHTDQETIETCLRLLREDCTTYLAEQSEATEKFHDRLSEFGSLSALGEKIENDNLEQVAQVETTLNNLGYMDFRSDLEKANHRLREEIKNLRMARHRLHDDHEAAFLMVARSENRIKHIETRLCDDPFTGLRSRIGIEVALDDWWRRKQHQTRPMNGILFDVDRFGAFNEEHGPLLGDRVLYQLAQLLQETVGKTDLVGRFAGQRFLWMVADVGPKKAIRNADFLRQSIEKIRFLYKEQTFQVTTRCIVAEVDPQEDYPAFLESLDHTFQKVETPRANRTFFRDGNKINPIDSPNLGAEEREIKI
ncbi:MAG: diguanylate cyclase [Pirellulales bacterium]|nr:diguanylate cyclase [Pirellulales bacterium]